MHAQIVLLRVVPPYVASPQILAEAETALAHRAEYLRSQGIHTECVVEVGHREAEIETIARARQVDLILDVPTSSRHLELEWYSRAATHARTEMPAPMLVWPESNADSTMLDAEDATIIVPVDGSATAERALPYAIMLAESYGRPILLVRVIPSQPPQIETTERVTERHKFNQAEANQYLTTLCSKVAQVTSVPVLVRLSVGNPGDEILRLAEQQKAGAIVVCAHSHIRRDRFFLGCVATQILRQANTPVLIVPQHNVLDLALPTIPTSIVVTQETHTHYPAIGDEEPY
jgi:nucleotide-binding universal stress UspA family protein